VSSELCTTCGFCCDGTLFSRVALSAGETEWAARRKLPLVEVDGETSMRQPCSFFRGSNCSVYSERPAKCQSYECRLLAQVTRGEISFDDARATIEKVRALATNIHSRVTRPWSDAHVRKLLDVATLHRLLVREFDARLQPASESRPI